MEMVIAAAHRLELDLGSKRVRVPFEYRFDRLRPHDFILLVVQAVEAVAAGAVAARGEALAVQLQAL